MSHPPTFTGEEERLQAEDGVLLCWPQVGPLLRKVHYVHAPEVLSRHPHVAVHKQRHQCLTVLWKKM
jgi:hypothetical protein